MDTRTPKQRRYIMQSVKTKHTGPEVAVRKIIATTKFKYRLHAKNLPGRPDIVFPRRRKVIFVNGCFWHGHHCRFGRLPKSNIKFWKEKIKKNKLRDTSNRKELRKLGWETTVIWQCQLKNVKVISARLSRYLKRNY